MQEKKKKKTYLSEIIVIFYFIFSEDSLYWNFKSKRNATSSESGLLYILRMNNNKK